MGGRSEKEIGWKKRARDTEKNRESNSYWFLMLSALVARDFLAQNWISFLLYLSHLFSSKSVWSVFFFPYAPLKYYENIKLSYHVINDREKVFWESILFCIFLCNSLHFHMGAMWMVFWLLSRANRMLIFENEMGLVELRSCSRKKHKRRNEKKLLRSQASWWKQKVQGHREFWIGSVEMKI